MLVCLLTAMQAHGNLLVETLESGMIEPSTRIRHLNAVKMTSYLICQFVDTYESEITKPSATVSGKVCTRRVYRYTPFALSVYFVWRKFIYNGSFACEGLRDIL